MGGWIYHASFISFALHMSFLKKIFCTLFAVYALVFTMITVIIVVPVYVCIFNFFSGARAPHAAHRVSQVWARVLFIAFLIRVKVRGSELIDKNRSYVFISNHRSQLDIPLLARSCRNTFRFLAKAELTKIPLLGYIIKNLYLTVKRKDAHDRQRSMEKMKRSLEEGISIVIYPEGTRNRTDAPLLDLRDGAFRLAIEAQVPLAVLTIQNMTARNSARDPFMLCPGTVHAAWAEPIDTRGMTEADLPALKEKARIIMMGNL